MNFFTSDLHLGNEETIKKDNRPFKNANQFKNHIIKVWNKQAKKEDTIYIIGDLIDCRGEESYLWQLLPAFVKKIKAKIVLIMGNNELRVVKYFFNNNFNDFKNYCLKNGISSVEENMYLKVCNERFFLTHKPKNHSKDCLTLFGHSHRSMGLYKSFGFNIGCDLNHFKLFSENDISHLLTMKKEFWDKDENLKLV